MSDNTEIRDLGIQPVDGILSEAGIDNHAVVAASSEQLTHKQVQRARKGRMLTPNMKGKITRAVISSTGKELAESDLFTY
ncbi:hypothetical protein OAK81_01060 [Verrucomicrobiales bacterium]|jgi:hypothetical protein|nr:hypothetical protein [Verrucomicrobiales bacterium]MDC0314208.1 hypothetical protein [bacterium]MDC0258986.1 hypothetical protein [Verrucomicrobiales bacterium]MDC0275763.1 hypothetical protein [Verrucomicrobiales bacterium]MDC0291861.1 hypothetical protein [Verrucomicrobiales bacterium]